MIGDSAEEYFLCSLITPQSRSSNLPYIYIVTLDACLPVRPKGVRPLGVELETGRFASPVELTTGQSQMEPDLVAGSGV